MCDIYAINLKVKIQIHIKLRCIYYCQVAYSLCAIWTVNFPKYLNCLVVHARWTGDIYFSHIKLSNYPYVRISSIAKQLMSLSIFRTKFT